MIALVAALAFAAAVPADAAPARCDATCIEERTRIVTPATLRRVSDQIAPAAPGILWASDGRSFHYARETSEDVVLYRVDLRRRARTVVARASDILRLAGRDAHDAGALPATALRVDAAGVIRLDHAGSSIGYDRRSGIVALPADPAAGEALSPDRRYAVSTRDHDLYVRERGHPARRLTQDGAVWHSFAGALAATQPTDRAVLEGRVDAQPPLVGWIGDGPKFFILRQDLRTTGSLWQIEALAQPRPRLVTQKMPLPGEAALPGVELWIFDAATGTATAVDTAGWAHIGNLDPGAGGIWPSRDGRTLFFARMTRGYGIVELCAADVATGAVRTLLREAWPGGSPIRFAEFRELRDGFVWKTERDGFQQYARYDAAGHHLRDLTTDPVSVAGILHVDERGDRMLYASFDDARLRNPAQVRLHRVELATGVARSLDSEDAHHQLTVAPDGRHIVDAMSRPDLAPTIVVRDDQGRMVMRVESSDTAALRATGWRPPVRRKVLAADGVTPLYAMVWTPRDRGPGERLPIVADVYPGPSGENVPVRFDPAHVDAQLAELGFAVVRSGQRGGSFVRDVGYQRYARTAGSVRDYPIADNQAVLRGIAASDGALDLDRVGIIGHSGGGLMAATAMLFAPDFYKVGVAASGNHDNNLYEMGSGEFHFGDPRTGPAGGAQGYATNAALADRLKGHLLLIHGALDDDVPIENTLRLADALVKAGKDFDMLVLPAQRHDYTGGDARYVRQRTWRYLLRYLRETGAGR